MSLSGRHALFGLGLALSFGPAWALSADRDQPIFIEADAVDIDERAGVSTYTGDVSLVQGSTRIEADMVKVFTTDRQLNKVTARGAPAHYRQLPSETEEEVEARAESILYTVATGLLVLSGNAELSQAGSRFEGARIEYDTRRDVVRASGAERGEERVRVVIQPEQLRENLGALEVVLTPDQVARLNAAGA